MAAVSENEKSHGEGASPTALDLVHRQRSQVGRRITRPATTMTTEWISPHAAQHTLLRRVFNTLKNPLRNKAQPCYHGPRAMSRKNPSRFFWHIVEGFHRLANLWL